ncbi:MAG: MBL fold metallo-hydrolase [Rhizobiaceae bacterium]|nr:MBL fold metallo-hydrolase [Rhizobiaceae bacterium]
MTLDLDTAFDPCHGEAVPVAPEVLRVTAPNAGPFTFHGTNSYVVGGSRSAIVVDPGPADDRHFAALMAAIDGRTVDAVLLTHTHRDHSDLVARLVAETGAPILAEGPHRLSRLLHSGETNPMDAAGDMELRPDRVVVDGEILRLSAATIEAVATPGHTANHMAFAVEGTGVLFCGDHVMSWSTTIVAPPDGSMADYMASLDRLIERGDTLLLPGHGSTVDQPQPLLRALKSHRRMREAAILERLRAGDRTIPEIVGALYRQTDPRLHGAAGLSVLAHLEDLAAKGRIEAEGEIVLGGHFRPT